MPIFNWNFDHSPDPQAALKTHGLRVAAEISMHPAVEKSLIAQNLPTPAPVVSSAIIDTGCTATSIDMEVAKTLGLVPAGIGQALTADGVRKAPIFAFQIQLTPNLVFSAFGLGCDLKEQKIGALVGLDLIGDCIFVVNGPAGTFSLAN